MKAADRIPRRQQQPVRAAWWALLALVLLFGQTLGQLHQGFHATRLVGPHAAVNAGATAQAPAGNAHARTEAANGWLGHLFGHDHALECRLLDQLAHADAPGFVPPVVAALPPAPLPTPLPRASVHQAPTGVPYSARAPPLA